MQKNINHFYLHNDILLQAYNNERNTMYQPKQPVSSLFAIVPALLSSLCNGNDLACCVQVACPIFEGNNTGTDCHIAN